MKIEVTHAKPAQPFVEGNIIRHKTNGNLFILGKQVAGHGMYRYQYFDILNKCLASVDTGSQFLRSDYELFDGTITLSNEA